MVNKSVTLLLFILFFFLMDVQAQNLALNKPAIASSDGGAGYGAANAFDGSGTTRWGTVSTATDPQWIYVDLGATHSIDRVKITWEAAYATSYQIQVSNVGGTINTNWTTIKTVSNNATTVNDWTGLTGNGRYVRMYGTSRVNTQWGYSIYEMEVYDTNTAPSIPTDVNGTANTVAENTTTGPVGITARSTDPDANTITYSLANTLNRFYINPSTGVVTVALTNGATLNYENATFHTITVRASDGISTSSQNFTITVTNVNEPPVINNITTSPSVPNTAVKRSINNLVGTDPDAGNTIASFKINTIPASGTLYINDVAVISGNTYPATNNQLTGLTYTPGAGNAAFTYSAIDSNNPPATSASVNYTIPVTADNAATYSYPQRVYSKFALQNGTTIATASDANGTIVNASVTGAALPSFLTLNANGTVTVNSNTVAEVNSTYSVTLTDANGGISTNVPLTLTITNDIYQANGNASKTGENCYQLTADLMQQRGQVWRTAPISLNNAFEISFDAYFGNHDGADGIAFGFQRATNPLFAVGNPGEGIGFGHGEPVSGVRSGGISPSVAIEFDTHNNLIASEIAADHIAIFKNGDERLPVKPAVQMSNTSANVEDGTSHRVQIIWQKLTNTLFVYFDGQLRERYTEDFVSTVFGNDPMVYFGYTASTGGLTNQQSVCDIEHNLLNSDSDALVDTNDLDDDNDGIPDLLESNGIDPSADNDDDGLPNFRDASPGGGISYIDINNDFINDLFDKDLDGIINAFDLDSDNDGITDVIEQAPNGMVPTSNYSTSTGRLTSPVGSNGIPSSSTTTANLNDFDGDGLKNFLDIDADNDGLRDYLEAQETPGLAPTLPAGADSDQDGIDDRYDATTNGIALNPQNFGLDADGFPDYLDINSDGDLFVDAIEAYDNPADATTVPGYSLNELKALATQFANTATNADNGTAVLYYRNNVDTDGDTVPDWLEDADADGILNYLDFGSGFYQDTDQDGLVDFFDLSNYGREPTPSYAFRQSTVNVALPVELMDFIVQSKRQEVQLYWKTASEKNNDYFVVERSLNAIAFQEIGKVKGAGTQERVRDYTFTDVHPVGGTSYYRLKMVDYDGRYSNSLIVAVKRDGIAPSTLLAYPNPNSGKLSLEITTNRANEASIEIVNIAGKIMQATRTSLVTGNNTVLLDLESIPAGMYLITVKWPGTYLVERVVKH